MSASQADENQSPVLTASVHDIRYLTSLLRGVNFVSRATVTVTDRGLTITVEEARTLLGTAFIFADVFDEYNYQSANPRSLLHTGNDDDEEDTADNEAFEISLNMLIECLNIFGTAGPTAHVAGGQKKWRRIGEDSGDDDDDDNERQAEGGRRRKAGGFNGRGIESYFGGGEKRTGMRMTYAGNGCPLTLLMFELILLVPFEGLSNGNPSFLSAEDATGPTTTCELATFDPEPHLELVFDDTRMVLKIILKSSWLRDALSELDPSCDKLTFIGNPATEESSEQPNARSKGKQRQRDFIKPIFRIQAAGIFGSTEMDYPNDRDVLETFECKTNISFSYRLTHITRTLRALQNSTKTSLRIDEEGLLSLQFLMPSPKNRPGKESPDAFLEFRVCVVISVRYALS